MLMPEPDQSPVDEPDSTIRNLPVVVPPPPTATSAPAPRDDHESWLGRMVRHIFTWKSGSTRADLEVVLEAGPTIETGFSPAESQLIRNILHLRERRVVDVMIPRADIIAVQDSIPLGELIKLFETAAHSRLVVFKETLDDAVGMVHIRDLIAFMTARAAAGAAANSKRKKPFPAGLDLRAVDLSMTLAEAQITREMLFVPPSMPAMDLLARMQAQRIHLALVIDEYGGADGLVSIEDIVEQIVGEIGDEHDDEETPDIVAQTDGSFLADARASLEDVLSIVGPEFDVGEAADDVDTLGGYLFAQVGRVPVRGELFPGPGPFELEVLDADPRRVKKLRVYRTADRRAEQGADAPAAPDIQASSPTDETGEPVPSDISPLSPSDTPTARSVRHS